MKKFVLMGLMTFSAPMITVEALADADAGAVSSERIDKKIRSGDWSVGGDLALSYLSSTGLQFRTSADVQKFLADGFSVGLVGRYVNANAYDFNAIGAKASYHFFETDKTTFYVSGDLTYNKLDFSSFGIGTDEFTSGSVAIGINYFLNPHIAFGPKLQWTHNLGLTDSAKSVIAESELSVLMGFTLFF